MEAGSTPYEDLVLEARAVALDSITRVEPRRIGIAFNGGKDSVVMAHLLVEAVGRDIASQFIWFAFDDPDEFPELSAFREAQAARFGIQVTLLQSCTQKEGLWDLHTKHGLEAAFLGSRKADPSGSWIKSTVTRCTAGWPDVQLYCPLLHWSVGDVWRYTHAHKVPFCELYLQGYTSLGSRMTTLPNPSLYCEETKSYRPAWELANGDEGERASRTPTPRSMSDSTSSSSRL